MWSKINFHIKSIRLRLTMWYAIILGITLLVYGAFLYYTLQRSLMMEAREFVSTTAHEDKFVIETRINNNRLKSLKGRDADSLLRKLASNEVFLAFRDKSGRIVSRSPQLKRDYSVPENLDIKNVLKKPSKITIANFPDLGRVLVCDLPIRRGSKVIGILEVGQSLQKIDSTVNKLIYILLFGAGGIFLLAGVGGYLLARFALSPIDHMASTANQICKGDFSQRINIKNREDEVGQLATTFNKMLDRLESLLKMKTQFVADASHELRTPLTVIQGNVNMLKRWGMNNPRVCSEALGVIDREVLRMSNIVSDLLILAQEDAGIPLKCEPVELDRILLETFKEAKILANDLSVCLKHEDQAMVWGDPERLKQMLLIFVDNAIKYTPPGGEISLSLYTTASHAKVVVGDTGIGIPDTDLPHIFERFYRVSKSDSGPKAGAGLGLSIAKRIVEAHKGHIEVKSQIGKGTTFNIFLPLGKDPQKVGPSQ